MANIKCKCCDNYITDPCEVMNSLFDAKMELENSPEESHVCCQILMINWTLENDLGLTDHEQLFKDFKLRAAAKAVKATEEPIVFTLECNNKHQNQYAVNYL